MFTHRPDFNDSKGYTYYINDHLSTPQKLITNTGRKVWEASADAFGKTVIMNNEFRNPLRFPGQYLDSESELYYNKFRFYSSLIGRYVSSDPMGLRAGINTYVYVAANPIKFMDFNGLEIYICNRKVNGFPGFGNHGYLWDDTATDPNLRSCGMQGSFGLGPTGRKEKGPSVDNCKKVSGSKNLEKQIMTCCYKNANNGLWTPGLNDCHNAADDCIQAAGLNNPGAPGGRLGPICNPGNCSPVPDPDFIDDPYNM